MARTKPIGIVLNIIFMVPFIGAGLAAVVKGVQGSFVGIPFGLLFIGVGVFHIVRTIRGARSAESLAIQGRSATFAEVIPQGSLDYRSMGRRDLTARELYARLLDVAPLPKLATLPGATLPIALPMSKTSQSPVAGIVFGIIWSLFTLVFVVAFATSPVVIFPALSVLIGVAIVGFSVRKLLGRMKLARVEISDEPLFAGDPFRVIIDQRGPANVTRLRVDLLCREHITYTVGTDTRTEEHVLATHELLDAMEFKKLRSGERWPHDLQATIPADGPSTFKSKNNSVAWLLRVRGEIAGWPDYDESYELRVLPRPPS